MQLKNWKSYLRFIAHKCQMYYSDISERVIGFFNLYKIKSLKLENYVLIIEFNPWHGETLPGYVKYFQDLGYSVVVVTKYHVYKENPFCRMVEKPLHLFMNIKRMKLLLNSPFISRVAYCLITSDPIWFNSIAKRVRVVDFLDKLPGEKEKCGIVLHKIEDSEVNPEPEHPDWSIDRLLQYVFVLTPMKYHGVVLPMLNPYYFGPIRKKSLSGCITRFITIGSVKKTTRNFSELSAALSNLKGNWELKVIGNIDDMNCLNDLPSQVKVLGRLDFESMYREIENSDYLLPLLDPECEAHKHYLNSCTSGSRQLILGFSIVPVIHEEFALHYGFSSDNAILYKKKTFGDAMQHAIDLSEEKYSRMVSSLQNEVQKVHDESFRNLKARMNLQN